MYALTHAAHLTLSAAIEVGLSRVVVLQRNLMAVGFRPRSLSFWKFFLFLLGNVLGGWMEFGGIKSC